MRSDEHAGQMVSATKRGGIVVSYGFTGTNDSNLATLRGALALFVGAAAWRGQPGRPAPVR